MNFFEATWKTCARLLSMRTWPRTIWNRMVVKRMLEPLIYCYRVGSEHILYRKVKDGLWGIAKGTDSVFNPQDVKKWYDSRIKAMTAMKRIEK